MRMGICIRDVGGGRNSEPFTDPSVNRNFRTVRFFAPTGKNPCPILPRNNIHVQEFLGGGEQLRRQLRFDKLDDRFCGGSVSEVVTRTALFLFFLLK